MTSVLRLVSHSPDDTLEIGRRMGQEAQAGDVYLLTGELGAGKTCLTQGIAWGLGIEGHTRSPTFVIMTRYRGRHTLYHIDLFRIGDSREAWDLGLEEYLFGDGICVVEWADRAPEVFPAESLWVEMGYGGEESERFINIGPRGDGQGRQAEGVERSLEPWRRH